MSKFPKFSQDTAQDPTTRRIWYGIATAHDFGDLPLVVHDWDAKQPGFMNGFDLPFAPGSGFSVCRLVTSAT
ncbi:hypothetical protein [Egbenema bharatensis]|uniref:hypothetical protein n=1 Tax=Egbenema bharatensis TaxID=3463334 RepID=UPI003A8A1AB9